MVSSLSELVGGELAVDFKLVGFGRSVNVFGGVHDDVVGSVFQVVPHFELKMEFDDKK